MPKENHGGSIHKLRYNTISLRPYLFKAMPKTHRVYEMADYKEAL